MREPNTRRVIISCEKRQHLGEQFAIAARLYSEAVVALTAITSPCHGQITNDCATSRKKHGSVWKR